jgi:hypothetical protein
MPEGVFYAAILRCGEDLAKDKFCRLAHPPNHTPSLDESIYLAAIWKKKANRNGKGNRKKGRRGTGNERQERKAVFSVLYPYKNVYETKRNKGLTTI